MTVINLVIQNLLIMQIFLILVKLFATELKFVNNIYVDSPLLGTISNSKRIQITKHIQVLIIITIHILCTCENICHLVLCSILLQSILSVLKKYWSKEKCCNQHIIHIVCKWLIIKSWKTKLNVFTLTVIKTFSQKTNNVHT